MNLEQSIEILNKKVAQKTGQPLTEAEIVVLRGALEGKTYEETTKNEEYSLSYLKTGIAPRLWKRLSEAFQSDIRKTNVQVVLNQKLGQVSDLERKNYSSLISTVVPEFNLYIKRPDIEKSCCEKILQPGALIRIKAPRQMGKTTLMHRILKHAEGNNYKIVYLNLLQAEEKVLEELDVFLRWFCASISRRLGIENQVNNFWDQNFGGSNLNCTAYFEEYLLKKLDNSPLVLGLDNADRLFAHESVAGDFFKLLRSWHEDAKFLDKWKKFRLVLAHSTEVYIPLDINSSPFGNVGLVIDLQEFSFEQVKDLVQKYDLGWDNDQIDKLMKMIGGHPYLVQTALAHLKANPSQKLEEFLKTAPTEEGIYDNHLREHLLTLKEGSQQDSNLETAMKQVVESKEPVRLNSQQVFKLESLGLVTVQGDDIKPRCELYRLFFRNRLLEHLSSTQ